MTADRPFSIYCHIAPNGKRYIGQTKCQPERRWGRGYKGCTYFEHAIEKYGWENFEHVILAECSTQEEANELEQWYISKYDTTNPEHGYNILKGGGGRSGFSMSEETKRKISESLTGRKGRKHTLEERERMSAAQKKCIAEGRKRELTEEEREFQRQVLYENAMANRHPVVQLSLDGEFIKRHDSVNDAARAVGAHSPNIIRCCQGNARQSHGYRWMYAEQYDELINPVDVGSICDKEADDAIPA